MTEVARLRSASYGLRLAGAALVLCVAVLACTPASAQGWFSGMFGGDQYGQQPVNPPYPGSDYQGQGRTPRARPRRRAPVVVQKDVAPVKTNASIFVDVFGDSLGQLLANGLDDALSDRADVGIVHRAKGSTGLVTKDFYDWPKAIDDLLASGTSKDKIDVAVMMVGSNDRQAITEDGKTYAFQSDEWTAAYKKRVTGIDEAFRKKGIPLVWVGVPITRDSNFANDMAAFNDVYRDAAAATGTIYVDTWEAFSDDNGEFDPYGPDINGQTVKLRSADGIHFTKAGARKLAHFVETQIRRALDGKTPPVELPTDSAPDGAPAVAAIKPEAGPIKDLNAPPAATDGQLAPPFGAKGGNGESVVETTLVKGEPAPAPKGRVDDFRWPADANR